MSMHTTLDLSQYNDVTAYADAVHCPVVHGDYLPTPQAVAHRVREAMDDRHLSMEQVAKEAHVSIQAVYSCAIVACRVCARLAVCSLYWIFVCMHTRWKWCHCRYE